MDDAATDRSRSGLVASALVGAALGLLDVAVLVWCGHAAVLPWASAALAFAVMLAFGLFVGLAVGESGRAAIALVTAAGRRWSGPAPGWVSADRAAALGLAAALASLGLSLAVTLDTRFGPATVRPETPRFAMFAAATALGFVTAAWWLLRRPHDRRARFVGWTVVGIGLLADALVVLFPFANAGKSWLMATGIVAGAAALAWGVVEPRLRGAPWLRAPRPRATLPVLVGLGAVCLFVPGHASYAVRTILHGRTTVLFPFLDDLPGVRLGIWKPAPIPAPDPPPPSPAVAARPAHVRGVVLVMIDALRPDFIGPGPDRASLTPNLDAFAASSTAFSRAYTTAPGTREAVRAMLSGCFHLRIPLPDIPEHTLFTELHERGIANAAVVAHPCIEAHFAAADRVYDEAFEDKLPAGRNARTSAMQTEAALQMLDGFGPDEPFVLFVHYYDPHEHYVVDHDEIGLGSKRERYAVEVAHTDEWIGRLLQAIDTRGLDDVAVIVASDHGDELWDHHGTGHLTRVYEESVRVFLAARVPGAAAAHVEDGLVSLTDVDPTVRELLGLPIPADLDGRSLVPALDGASFPRRSHLVVQARDGLGIVGVLAGDHKLIVNELTGILELYDLRRDPGELVNLADDPPIDLTPLLQVAATSHVGAWPYRACPS